jgi:hypothetical protein
VTSTIDGIFQGVSDRFQGITVDSVAESCPDDVNFRSTLESKIKVQRNIISIFTIITHLFFKESLQHWIEQKRRAIWFKVHLDQASYVPILALNDFKFHHARDEYVMMYKWLPKNEQMAVPPFAHTMVIFHVRSTIINQSN